MKIGDCCLKNWAIAILKIEFLCFKKEKMAILILPSMRGKVNNGYLVIVNVDKKVSYIVIDAFKYETHFEKPNTYYKNISFYCKNKKEKHKLCLKLFAWRKLFPNSNDTLSAVLNNLGSYLDINFNQWISQYNKFATPWIYHTIPVNALYNTGKEKRIVPKVLVPFVWKEKAIKI